MGDDFYEDEGGGDSTQGSTPGLFYRKEIGQFLEDVKEEYLLLANLDPTRVATIKAMSIGDYCILLRNLRKKKQPSNGDN